jgi:hypothetical protein
MSAPGTLGLEPEAVAPASTRVIDAITGIEIMRREAEREAGIAMSCRAALRCLHELLGRETDAWRLRGPDAEHPKSIDAVKLEIGRLIALAASSIPKSFPARPHTEERQLLWQNALRNPAKSKGRRTMGRANGR